ncbi:MAG TPA: RsmE family RNA methyltransferase [Clostridia bacterium]|nr:RsmE family RNA methyltransferase [Clostridia bacterium]
MRRRWIADELDRDRAALTGQHAAHLARVLRARVGQEFDIAAGDRVRLGRVTSVGDDRVEFELGAEVEAVPQSETTVVLAIFKFDRFEWAVEKCTELGAARLVPLIARRTDAHLAHAALKRVERWRRIAHEAAQQSRRVAPPEISEPVRIKDALRLEATTRVILAETERQASLKDFFLQDGSVALAIGPEGGWTEDELKMFADAGWSSASLGSTILRAETAAIAALAIAQSAR